MKTGELRLKWDDNNGIHLFQCFRCLDDALKHAAQIVGEDTGTLTGLYNWLGEECSPLDQVRAVAKMRAAEAKEQDQLQHIRDAAQF